MSNGTISGVGLYQVGPGEVGYGRGVRLANPVTGEVKDYSVAKPVPIAQAAPPAMPSLPEMPSLPPESRSSFSMPASYYQPYQSYVSPAPSYTPPAPVADTDDLPMSSSVESINGGITFMSAEVDASRSPAAAEAVEYGAIDGDNIVRGIFGV